MINRDTCKGILVGVCASLAFMVPAVAHSTDNIKVFVNGAPLQTDVAPIIVQDRTMVPLRAISENLGMEVRWDAAAREVHVNSPSVVPGDKQSKDPVAPSPLPPLSPLDNSAGGSTTVPEAAPPTATDSVLNYPAESQLVPIRGESVATAAQLRSLQLRNNPQAPDLAELYIQIGKDYGIRGDLAFCQAAKETGWWKFGNLVTLDQNNYCGLGATGAAATGAESLNGADPTQVKYVAGVHGAIFATPAAGVEAHIQHLYAYVTADPLPAGKVLLDPRYTLVRKGIAVNWADLNGKWAVPGTNYGQSIYQDYFKSAF